jgi:hypothetical protein
MSAVTSGAKGQKASSVSDQVLLIVAAAGGLMGGPLLVHSTSWRRARAAILSFAVVNRDGHPRTWTHRRMPR